MITGRKDAVRPRVPRGHKLAAVGRDDPLAPPRRQNSNGFRLSARCRSAYCRPLRESARHGRTAMAKGQKRSNREAKKPKANKKKDLASTGTVSNALAKPKPRAATAESKK